MCRLPGLPSVPQMTSQSFAGESPRPDQQNRHPEPEYAPWEGCGLAKTPLYWPDDARFRSPAVARRKTNPVDEFDFAPLNTSGATRPTRWAYDQTVPSKYVARRWICGVESGGAVENLPAIPSRPMAAWT